MFASSYIPYTNICFYNKYSYISFCVIYIKNGMETILFQILQFFALFFVCFLLLKCLHCYNGTVRRSAIPIRKNRQGYHSTRPGEFSYISQKCFSKISEPTLYYSMPAFALFFFCCKYSLSMHGYIAL